MPLFDHLSELRRRLTVSVAALVLAACGLYFVAPELIYILVRPILEYITKPEITPLLVNATSLHEHQVLNFSDVFGAFALRFKVSLVFALFVTSPVWIWQVLGFFNPALRPNERKWVIPTFFAAIALFCLGAVFCYLVILDPAFQWLIAQAEDVGHVLPFADAYVNTILLFEIGFGVAFELPLVVFYLTVFNIIPYKKLRASWRVVYVVLMVVSAVVTPDASPITMILMFAAMTALYEGSLFISRLVLRRRMARLEAEAEDGYKDESEDDAEGQ
ncbi:MAG: twin-arginine translocase subunit TatC [Actinomycetia bacterium]|nr:twin-arginine translocase subunit TatC [Actinomycetes bacterium]